MGRVGKMLRRREHGKMVNVCPSERDTTQKQSQRAPPCQNYKKPKEGEKNNTKCVLEKLDPSHITHNDTNLRAMCSLLDKYQFLKCPKYNYSIFQDLHSRALNPEKCKLPSR